MYEINREQYIEQVNYPLDCKCVSCPIECEGTIGPREISLEKNIPLIECTLVAPAVDGFCKISSEKEMCSKKRHALFIQIDGDIEKIAPSLYWKMLNKMPAYKQEIAERELEVNEAGYYAAMEYLFKREVQKRHQEEKKSFWSRFKR